MILTIFLSDLWIFFLKSVYIVLLYYIVLYCNYIVLYCIVLNWIVYYIVIFPNPATSCQQCLAPPGGRVGLCDIYVTSDLQPKKQAGLDPIAGRMSALQTYTPQNFMYRAPARPLPISGNGDEWPAEARGESTPFLVGLTRDPCQRCLRVNSTPPTSSVGGLWGTPPAFRGGHHPPAR